MDLGHQLTDEELAKLERKIAKVYKTAADEMQDKITEYFKKFDEQDKKKRELLEQGKITEQEYKQWRLGKLATGKKYQSMRDQLAERMTNANQEAVAYVNSSTPTVYSLNRNYTAYQIEQADINASFQLWDESTVARLIKDNPELMPNYPKEKALARGIDLDWGKKQISKEITTGILLGESNQRIAKRLLTELPNMNKASAIRTARTATTSAECAGRQDTYESAKAMGIVLKKRWVCTHDARTREEHLAADGQSVDVDKPFEVGGEKLMNPGDTSGSGWNIYNCFSGDIKVASDSKAIRSYKHEYNGDLICIKTSAGVEFTCTPNHPILTPDGWVSANAFNKGDDILITIVGNNMLFGRNPDIEHIFPSFSAFHKSIKMFRGQRTIALGVDFHGDIAATDVEVVTQKGFLPENGDTSRFKSLRKFIFKHTYISLACKSAFMEHFRSVVRAFDSLMSIKSKSFPFLRRHVCHSNIHRLRTSPDMNICLPEYSINNLPAETIIRSELLNGFTAKVFVDKVVDVKIISSNSHVYNLQTENGYYFVNSIIPQNGSKVNGIFAIAKNCRCTTVADIDTKASAKNKNPVSFNKWVEEKQTAGTDNKLNFATVKEAEEWITKSGVDFTILDGFDLETANIIANAVNTLPEGVKPKSITNLQYFKKGFGSLKPFGRKDSEIYGVTIDNLWGINFGNGMKDIDGGIMVAYNSRNFKNAKAISLAKKATNEKYKERTGRMWHFNMSGEATYYHEIGHSYAQKKGIPQGFSEARQRWYNDSKCDILQTDSEAWAEAWAAYYLKDKRLPDYIAEFIKGVK